MNQTLRNKELSDGEWILCAWYDIYRLKTPKGAYEEEDEGGSIILRILN
jgi:hypothetical protein